MGGFLDEAMCLQTRTKQIYFVGWKSPSCGAAYAKSDGELFPLCDI
jgi:hypothetical protein